MNNYEFYFYDTIIGITTLLKGVTLILMRGKIVKGNCGTIKSCDLELTQNCHWYNLTNRTFTKQYVKYSPNANTVQHGSHASR
jgi:hypothetical protein